jgi:uncharacterized protein (DUF2141 family)
VKNNLARRIFVQMKHLRLLLILLFGLLLNIGNGVAQELEVIVKNIKSDKGVLMIGLFNSEKTFTKEIWKGERPDAKIGEVKVVFKNVPPGSYAISIFHDENSNGKLDANLMGIPKEGIGFSNDAMGTFGPPSFEKAKIVIPGNKSVFVTLKYL